MEVVNCAPFVAYIPNYFFSRYPRQVSKLWNLLGLFTPAAWLFSFISFLSVVLVLKITAVVGTKYFDLKSMTKEMVLNPFRHGVEKIIVNFITLLSQSKSKSKCKVQSPKSKGLGVTLFCCATHHISACATPYLRLRPPTQTFLSNQTSN